MKWPLVGVLAVFLGGLFLAAPAAPFLAPYPAAAQNREWAYMPPTRMHLRDDQGRWHWRPFIYGYEAVAPFQYRWTGEKLFIGFLVETEPYPWLGGVWKTRLFGLETAGRKIFLFGTDSLGRDLFSRILHGARFSLSTALWSIVCTILLGTLLGAVAGYRGGWLDAFLMRGADFFLALPALFLILALRSLFPLEVSADRFFWLVVLIFTMVGWASVTRIIRGQVAALRAETYVVAARAYGASPVRILGRHILPFTLNTIVVQATVLLPAFILGEVTLSFLGVGVQEPHASWGNLLSSAVSLHVLTDYPWLLWPAFFIFAAVFSLNLLADELRAPSRRLGIW